MENNNYLQVLSTIDMEADKNNELFHIGKPLFAELERLKDEGLNLEMENFLINLGQLEEKALYYVIDENNNRVDIFNKLLLNMENQKATDSYKETPRIFRKNLDSLRPTHPAFHSKSY